MYKDIDKVSFPDCQKVLPLTYDNSLSYYEAICKLIEKLNQVIAIINMFDPPDLTDIYNRLDAIEAVNESQQEDIDRNWYNIQNQAMLIESLMTDVADIKRRLGTLETNFQTLWTKVYDDHEPRIEALERALKFFIEPVTVSSMPIEAELYDLSEVTIHE